MDEFDMFVSDGNNAVLTNNDSLTSIENISDSTASFPLDEGSVSIKEDEIIKSENGSLLNKNSIDVLPPNQNSFDQERAQQIASKDAEEKIKNEDLRSKAQSDLQTWYDERKKQMENRRQTNRFEEDHLDTNTSKENIKQSCNWSKLINLVDFTDGKQYSKSKRDLSRMKSCIFNAKRFNNNQNNI